MFFRKTILTLCSVCILLVFQGACRQTKSAPEQQGVNLLSDPIFGLSYNPSLVHYDQIPETISRMCRGFKAGRWWVFAHVQREKDDYFIVMGSVAGQDSDSFGTALWIEGSTCHETDSQWVLSGRPASKESSGGPARGLPGLDAQRICDHGPAGECHYQLRSPDEQKVLVDLVTDAIRRASDAYGGIAQFKQRACSPSFVGGLSESPMVQQELQNACSMR